MVVGLVLTAAVFGLRALWSRVVDDDERVSAAPADREDSNQSFDDGFIDAMAAVLAGNATLGIERAGQTTVLTVPTCFGPVNRVAVVSPDLRSTSWEVVAQGEAVQLDVITVGEVPTGFIEVVPLDGPNKPIGFFVANGPAGHATTLVRSPGNVLPDAAASCR
jgi:hypothetical protein